VSDSCEIGQNHHYSVKCTDLPAQNILFPTAASNDRPNMNTIRQIAYRIHIRIIFTGEGPYRILSVSYSYSGV
jgi:hypothetical protein